MSKIDIAQDFSINDDSVQLFLLNYAVDIVLVIDATGSMGPTINNVKALASGFHHQIQQKMREKEKKIEQLRLRLVVFRDYYADAEDAAMIETPFYTMPDEEDKLVELVRSIRATGGGDAPENGLEALALAMQSPWEQRQEFQKFRHIIVLFTDTTAHPLEKPGKPSYYPDGLPKDIDELYDFWSDEMDSRSKRLVLLAPDVSPWNMLNEDLSDIEHIKSQAGFGLAEVTVNDILTYIANSV